MRNSIQGECHVRLNSRKRCRIGIMTEVSLLSEPLNFFVPTVAIFLASKKPDPAQQFPSIKQL